MREHDVRAAVACRHRARHDDHRGLGDVGMAQQRRLDLAELDAEAADLDLVVGAAEEVEQPSGVQRAMIAGVIEPLAVHERARDEALLRERRVVQVAARDTPAPPMYISPGTPIGARLPVQSRM